PRTNGRYNGTVRRPPQGWTASVPRSSAQALLKGRQASRRLAHCTTAGNVGGLNFRVRDGTGCIPAALAVKPLLRRPRGCAIYQDFDGPVLLQQLGCLQGPQSCFATMLLDSLQKAVKSDSGLTPCRLRLTFVRFRKRTDSSLVCWLFEGRSFRYA